MTPNLNKALRQFQMDMKAMGTNAKGHNNKYANMGGVISAIRPALKYGLSYSQGTKCQIDAAGNPYMVVTTKVLHDSGEYLEYEWPIKVKDPTNSQQLGSATTYAKRYLLAAAFGAATDVEDFQFDFDDDDDGVANGLLNDETKPDEDEATPNFPPVASSGQPSGNPTPDGANSTAEELKKAADDEWADAKESIQKHGLKPFLQSLDNVDDLTGLYKYWRKDKDLTVNPNLAAEWMARKAEMLGAAA